MFVRFNADKRQRATLHRERGGPVARILVVEDEPDVRFLLRVVLEDTGHEVLEAHHGAAAIECVKESPPDLVITDIMMPVMDGRELVERLRSDPETAAIPILVVSANAHLPVPGADAALTKRGQGHLSGQHSFDIGPGGLEVFPRLETLAPREQVAVSGRLSTGVPGLDDIMGGGIPAGDATAILGSSGVGKTVLALRFIVQGLEDGVRCLYVSFQENAGQLAAKAASFGWDVGRAIESGQLVIHHIPHGSLNLDAVGAAVRAELAKGSVGRVVIDSLAELVVTARESERFPAYARSLVGFIRAAGASLVVTSETSTLGPILEPTGGLSYLFHDVILLRYIELDSEVRRAVNVLKMRDSGHEKGLAQYEVDAQGFHVLGKLEGLTGVLGWTALRRQETAG